MGRSRFTFVLCLLALTACGSQKAQTRFGVPRNAAQTLAWEVGRELYAKDRAAWLATDALLAHGQGTMDPRGRGWLVLPGAQRVAFYGFDAGVPKPLYYVDVSHSGETHVEPAPPEAKFSSDERTAIIAREKAKTVMTTHCGAGWNTVVLPGSMWKQDGWLVYFLVPQVDANRIPTSGHTRVHVSKDGQKVLGMHTLSPGCGALTAPGPNSDIGIATPHSDIVLEHFFFVALAYRVNLNVAAGGRILMIPGGEPPSR